MNNPKILVTGCNGQLGKELQAISSFYPDFEFIFLSKEELPIHHREQIHQSFASLKPQYCINCAAYTAVDRAETEKELAFTINGDSAGKLAEACKSFGVKFIHISTDYVFSGHATTPYKEDDPVDPVNIYGASKLRGEELAVSNNDQTIIIRTSWVYSEFGNNFVKTMMRLMKDKDRLGIVNDQLGSPTYAADLARLIIEIIKSGHWQPGIYHYSNEGVITWYEFAEAIREILGSKCIVSPIYTIDFPTVAKRPSYSVFDTTKIKLIYKNNIPFWKDSLRVCLKRLN
ncbi:MAG: dTDP-4-dehydrorhamnose reductase [Chitinophagaceae bacterium]